MMAELHASNASWALQGLKDCARLAVQGQHRAWTDLSAQRAQSSRTRQRARHVWYVWSHLWSTAQMTQALEGQVAAGVAPVRHPMRNVVNVTSV